MKTQKGKNLIVGVLGTLGIATLFIGGQAFRQNKWLNQLFVKQTGNIIGVRDDKIMLKCQTIIENSKGIERIISKPSIQIFNQGKRIAMFTSKNEKIKISKHTNTSIDYEFSISKSYGNIYKTLLNSSDDADKKIDYIIKRSFFTSRNSPVVFGVELDVEIEMKIGFGLKRRVKVKMII